MTNTHEHTGGPRSVIGRSTDTCALGDIGVAPENMRGGQEPDDNIAELASTIAAAGLLYPLLVRAGRKGEQPFMALDGRRRLMALNSLAEAGSIAADHPVRIELVIEKTRQVAAVVVANTQRAPVHVADVIVAIGKLRSAKMTSAKIAAALGYDELAIRRLQCLAELPKKATDALRAGKINLATAKLLAQVKDPHTRDSYVEQAAGGYLSSHVIKAHLETRPTVEDPQFALVGMTRYTSAGGRLDADLFDQFSDVLLDPDILQVAWRERAKFLVDAAKAEGVTVFYCPAAIYRAPEGYIIEGSEHRRRDRDEVAYQQALRDEDAIGDRLSQGGLDGFECDAQLAELLRARLTRLKLLYGERLGAVSIYPDSETGFQLQGFLTPRATPEVEQGAPDEDDEESAEAGAGSRAQGGRYQPDVAIPGHAIDTEGRNHSLHETYTDIATRGLIRTVADDPMVALTITVARMFVVLALQGSSSTDNSATTVQGRRYCRTGYDPLPALDGLVRDRLSAKRDAYLATGLRPIPWVDSLPHGEKMELLAELIAISLDLRETNNTMIRTAARAEAAEIAELTDHDITAFWTPDVAFLGQHNKAQLMGALKTMEADEAPAKSMKKDELVGYVATMSAEKGWAPPALNLRREMIVIEDTEAEAPGVSSTPQDDELADEDPADDAAADPDVVQEMAAAA